MTTRLKTIKYAFPTLASLSNNTLTTLTQITLYLPENSKTFKSVVAHVTFDDIITNTGGSVTTKTLNLRLGAAAYTSVANGNTLTNSGENISFWLAQEFTDHFVTNWSGTSMTCDFQLQINQSTGTTTGLVNVSVTLDITYEYDDTSSTHVKTAMIPLNMPVGAIATTATTYDTIPALDTYLPEASKTYRSIYVVVQGNEHRNAATTDHTMTLRVGATSVTTGNYEGALGSDRLFRYVWELTSSWPSTAATQTWQPTATVARCNHLQAYLVVTYEFDPASTTTVMNSLMLPMDMSSPMGGTTSSDYQRATRSLWIQEPGTITTEHVAFFPFWQQAAAIGGLNMRLGTGSFVTYTDAASVMCGANAAMVRNDSAFTLARGRNTLNFDAYRTDTADYGWNVSGFWLVNYTSSKATQGVGAHNHTVEWSAQQNGTAAATSVYTTTGDSPAIPETEHYLTALGISMIVMPSGTTPPVAFVVGTERLTAEGGMVWESVYSDSAQNDAEVGVVPVFAQMRDLFLRWPTDPDDSRMNIETARRWRVTLAGAAANPAVWVSLNYMMTYHTITKTISGTVSGYADADGAGLTVRLFRINGDGYVDHIGNATTTTGGAYTFTWYDDTETVFAAVHEDATHVGTSATGTAV
jgi:hypothetical protein